MDDDQSDFSDEVLEDKFRALLDEDNDIKQWNEGLLVKSLILLPIIIFIIGLFMVNRPESFSDLLLIFLYPLALILIGLIILFVMTRNLK